MLRMCFGVLLGALVHFLVSSTVHAQETLELPGIVVTASPFETPEDEVFAATTVISEEEIESTFSRTLGDTFFTKPGVTSSTFAAGASRPIIRGLDNFRVGIVENGIGVHDVSALSEDHGIPIDPLATQKIEIIRGPATLRWGSQAIGGVVNATNNRIPSEIPNGQYQYLEIDGGYSSVDNGREGSVVLGAGIGNFAFHADVYKRQGDDYDTPDGVQEGTSYDAEGGALGASLVFDRGYIGVSYSRYQSLYFIPGEEATERALRIDLEQDKFSSKGEYRPRDSFISHIKYWFGYTDYIHDEIGEDEDTGELSVGSTFENKQYEARTEILHNPFSTSFGPMKGALGFQYGYRDLQAAGEGGELLAPSETVNFAAYLFEELQATDKLKLQFAGRLEHVDIDGAASEFTSLTFEEEFEGEAEPASRTFTPYSLSTGALYQFSNGIVGRVTGQYVERAPDVLELFAKGPHEATETFEIGDPNLDKEKAVSVEVGLKKSEGRLRFDASAYYSKYDGFIFKDITGNACIEGGGCFVEGAPELAGEEGLTQILYSQKDATIYGVELSASYDVAEYAHGTVGIDGQYDFVRAEFDDGTNVPRITPQRLGFGVYYKSEDLYARVGALHAFRQDDTAENEGATSGYTLVNAEVNYTFKFEETGGLVPEFTIGITGENLLDDDVRNHVSFKKEDVLQPGRNILLRGKMKLN